MSEELNRQEAELNEAALANVSGGYDFRDAIGEAGTVCTACSDSNPSKNECELQHRKDLANYLLEHGRGKIRLPWQCPYYNS